MNKVSAECETCGATFSGVRFRATLQAHLLRQHSLGPTPLSCDLCARVAGTSQELFHHFAAVHGLTVQGLYLRRQRQLKQRRQREAENKEGRLHCDSCQGSFRLSSFTSRSALFSHWLARHADATASVAELRKSRNVIEATRMAQKKSVRNSGQASLACDVCDHVYSSKNNLIRHVSQNHNDGKGKQQHTAAVCDECGKKLSVATNRRLSMFLHLATHGNVYKKVILARKNLLARVRARKDRKYYLFNCDDCRSSRSRDGSRMVLHYLHFHSHPSKPEVLSQLKSFKELKRQKNSKDMHCDLCSYHAIFSATMTYHLAAVHGLCQEVRHHQKTTPHYCDECPKSYTSSTALLTHVLRHHGLPGTGVQRLRHQVEMKRKEYASLRCDSCGRTTSQSRLVQHVRRCGEVFRCNQCSFRAPRQSELHRHFRFTHAGAGDGWEELRAAVRLRDQSYAHYIATRWQCDECGKKMAPSAFVKHLRACNKAGFADKSGFCEQRRRREEEAARHRRLFSFDATLLDRLTMKA